MSTLDEVATLELPFKPPFDWPRLLRFFGGRATPGVEAVEDGAYRRAIEWAGHTPRVVQGSLRNFKVTYPEDFALAEAILARPANAS